MSNRLMEMGGGGFGGGAGGFPTFSPLDGRVEAVNDNLVHELTLAGVLNVLSTGYQYVVQAIGGEGIAVMQAAAAPLVATIRANGIVLLNGDSWVFVPSGQKLWCVKLVDGTANADMHIVATGGGLGL